MINTGPSQTVSATSQSAQQEKRSKSRQSVTGTAPQTQESSFSGHSKSPYDKSPAGIQHHQQAAPVAAQKPQYHHMVYAQQAKPKPVEEAKKKMTASVVETSKDMRRSVSKSVIDNESSYSQIENPFGLGSTMAHYGQPAQQPVTGHGAYPRNASKDSKQQQDRSPLARDHSKSRLDQSQTSNSFSQHSHMQYSAYSKKPSMTSTQDEDSVFKSSQYMQTKEDNRYITGKFTESTVMREKSQNRPQESTYSQANAAVDPKRKVVSGASKAHDGAAKQPVGYYYGAPKRDSVEGSYAAHDADAKKRKPVTNTTEADYPYFGQMSHSAYGHGISQAPAASRW